MNFNLPFHVQLLSAAGVLVTGTAGLTYALNESVKAGDLVLHAPSYPWPHNGILSSIDMAGYVFIKMMPKHVV